LKGNRITVTYDLYSDPLVSQVNILEEEKLRISGLPFYKAMETALYDPEFASHGAELGFFANHAYPWEKFGQDPPHLQGSDLQRFAVFKYFGLRVDLRVLLMHNIALDRRSST
jgi:hypothetical protein